MRILGIGCLLLLASTLIAAPIPKKLKQRKTDDIHGVWQLVQFDNNRAVSDMAQLWEVHDGKLYIGLTTADERGKASATPLTVPDPTTPLVMKFGEHPCVFECDGDELRWTYSSDPNQQLTQCGVGPKRHAYVFKRVRSTSGDSSEK